MVVHNLILFRKALYLQRIQEQVDLVRRRFPPLQAGCTLRIRHPSRPTPVEVQLESGQKHTSFPHQPELPPTAAHAYGLAGWDPLPTPPGARYTFEARLRALRQDHAGEAPDIFPQGHQESPQKGGA